MSATTPLGRGEKKCVRGKCYVHICTHAPLWKIDGRYYCILHADLFWDNHFIEEHKVIRLV